MSFISRAVIVTCVLCLPAVGWAQEKIPPLRPADKEDLKKNLGRLIRPSGPVVPQVDGCPPAVAMAMAVYKDGMVQLRLTERIPVVQERIEKVIVDGKEIEFRQVVSLYVPRETTIIADGKKVMTTRKDGKTVDPMELPRLLEKPTAVVVFTGERDPYYLQVVHDQVLVITRPRSEDQNLPILLPPLPPPLPREK